MRMCFFGLLHHTFNGLLWLRIVRSLTRTSGWAVWGSSPPRETEGRTKHDVLEPFVNGNFTDQLSAKLPGATMGGNINR
jgi:hypothetical protein